MSRWSKWGGGACYIHRRRNTLKTSSTLTHNIEDYHVLILWICYLQYIQRIKSQEICCLHCYLPQTCFYLYQDVYCRDIGDTRCSSLSWQRTYNQWFRVLTCTYSLLKVSLLCIHNFVNQHFSRTWPLILIQWVFVKWRMGGVVLWLLKFLTDLIGWVQLFCWLRF